MPDSLSPSDALAPSPQQSQLAPAIGQLVGDVKASGQKVSDAADTLKTGLADSKAKTDALVPPTLTELPKQEQTQSHNPAQAFGSAAGLLAVFGGLLTRKSLVDSLNAAAGVMNASKQQDQAAAQKAFDTWKINSDNAIKLQNFKMDAYKAAIEKAGNDDRAMVANFQATASAMGDRVAHDMAAVNGVEGIQRAMNENERLTSDMKLAAQQIDQGKQKADLWTEWQKEHPDATADQKLAKLQEIASGKVATKGSTPFAIAYNTEQQRRSATGEPPMTEKEIVDLKNGLNTPRSGTAIAVQKFVEEHKDDNGGKGPTAADVQKFLASGSALSAAQRSLFAGPIGLQLKSLGVATDHLTTLRDLNEAFKGGDEKTIAAAKARWQTEFGTPAPSNMDLAAQFVAPELIKAIEGTPGGVSERDEMAKAFQSARGQANVDGAINTAFALMGGQMNGMKNQVVKVDKLMSPEEFDDMIPSTALDAMQKHQTKSFKGGASAPPPPEAITQLKSDPSPEMQGHFDEIFGPGSAKKALGQ